MPLIWLSPAESYLTEGGSAQQRPPLVYWVCLEMCSFVSVISVHTRFPIVFCISEGFKRHNSLNTFRMFSSEGGGGKLTFLLGLKFHSSASRPLPGRYLMWATRLKSRWGIYSEGHKVSTQREKKKIPTVLHKFFSAVNSLERPPADLALHKVHRGFEGSFRRSACSEGKLQFTINLFSSLAHILWCSSKSARSLCRPGNTR